MGSDPIVSLLAICSKSSTLGPFSTMSSMTGFWSVLRNRFGIIRNKDGRLDFVDEMKMVGGGKKSTMEL